MSDFVIVTDSTTDLPQSLVDQLGIVVVPLSFTIDNKTYFNYPDERDMTSKAFYQLLRQGKPSSTAQINVTAWTEAFEAQFQQGKDVLCVAFSSALSGTCQSASFAAQELKNKYPERKICVVDSFAASMGEGLLVYHAVMHQRAGEDIDTVKQWLEENRNRLCHWFTVDDLYHLKRGGRVSATAAVVGTVLGIKPVLHVDMEGRLIPVSKVRGRRQSLEELVHRMKLACEEPDGQMVFISHGDCAEEAKFVADLVKEAFAVKDVIANPVGPVIGSHSGPGTMALFFLGKKDLI